jgi:hypothetical protein
MLNRGMDRIQLDTAYNNTAAVPERAMRSSPDGWRAAPRCGASALGIST